MHYFLPLKCLPLLYRIGPWGGITSLRNNGTVSVRVLVRVKVSQLLAATSDELDVLEEMLRNVIPDRHVWV
jgi:hypothetical protein